MNRDGLPLSGPVSDSLPDAGLSAPDRLPVEEIARLGAAILDRVATVVVGMTEAVEMALASILAGGHVLFEDVPGLGKTLAARSLASAVGLDFRRLQCTPDLLPADITGSFVYSPATAEFVFRPGPVFTGLFLADEINRTSPKTQSALLEAMAEGQVTVEGQSFGLPSPVPRRRNLQSDRIRGHLRAPRGTARPLPGAPGRRLSRPRRRGADSAQPRRAPP